MLMKDFYGNTIAYENHKLNWSASNLVFANDGKNIVVGTANSSGNVKWVVPRDGYLICHVWGNNGGKITINNDTDNMLVMTLGNPTANTGSPQRVWIPVYKDKSYSFQNDSKFSQALYLPYVD